MPCARVAAGSRRGACELRGGVGWAGREWKSGRFSPSSPRLSLSAQFYCISTNLLPPFIPLPLFLFSSLSLFPSPLPELPLSSFPSLFFPFLFLQNSIPGPQRRKREMKQWRQKKFQGFVVVYKFAFLRLQWDLHTVYCTDSKAGADAIIHPACNRIQAGKVGGSKTNLLFLSPHCVYRRQKLPIIAHRDIGGSRRANNSGCASNRKIALEVCRAIFEKKKPDISFDNNCRGLGGGGAEEATDFVSTAYSTSGERKTKRQQAIWRISPPSLVVVAAVAVAVGARAKNLQSQLPELPAKPQQGGGGGGGGIVQSSLTLATAHSCMRKRSELKLDFLGGETFFRRRLSLFSPIPLRRRRRL